MNIYRNISEQLPVRLNGQIPVDNNLDINSLQAPPIHSINHLFNYPPVAIDPQYGGYFNPVISYQDFPKGLDPIITSFEIGATNSGMKIYGVNNDNTEELLVTDSANVTTFQTTSKKYKRLKYVVTNGATPTYVKLFGSYNKLYKLNKVPFTKYPLGNHTGTNGHPYNLLEDVTNPNIRYQIYPPALVALKRLGAVRLYVDNVNINNDKGVFTFDMDRQGYAIDALVTQLHEEGVHFVWCMQAITPWIAVTYPEPNSNYERAPVAYGADRMNPASWADYAEIAFQIALRYGTNANNLPLSASKSRVGYFYEGAPEVGSFTKKVGLNILKEIEPYNEWDKWWKGSESYVSAREAAVGMRVIYDRIKEADPHMIVSFPGLASFGADYFQEFVEACIDLYGYDANGNVRIPVDGYNYHYYPTKTGSQYGSTNNGGSAIDIVANGIIDIMRKSNYYKLGNKFFDCGEIGYDANSQSPLRGVVPNGSGYTQREWIGILYLRVALFHAKQGVRRTFHYQWTDLSENDDYNQFVKMGLLHVIGTTFIGYPNYNQLAQLRQFFGDFTHDKEVNIYPLVDRWKDTGDKTMYTLFMPSENNSSANYTLNLPNGGMLYKFSLSDITPVIEELPSGDNIIRITEKPCFILANK